MRNLLPNQLQSDLPMSDVTAKLMGKALGSWAYDQALHFGDVPKPPRVGFDCVGIEESDIWYEFSKMFGMESEAQNLMFAAMYEEAGRLVKIHQMEGLSYDPR